MRSVTLARTRRRLAAGVLFLAAAVLGACDGTTSVEPGRTSFSTGYADTTYVPGDTTGIPGDTTGIPGDTTGIPGDTTGIPGDTTGIPGDTTGIPGDTVGVPGDTLGVPGDTVGVPGDTLGIPGDTVSGPRRSHMVVSVVTAADSGGVALVAGAVVTVSRGGSPQEVARLTTTRMAPLSLWARPGRYTVRLESVPAGWRLAPGESAERRVIASPGGRIDVRFVLQR